MSEQYSDPNGKWFEVDVFTEKSVDTKFPENTYWVDKYSESSRIISNVGNTISGIVKVEVWINQAKLQEMEDERIRLDIMKEDLRVKHNQVMEALDFPEYIKDRPEDSTYKDGSDGD